jgi:membrane protein
VPDFTRTAVADVSLFSNDNPATRFGERLRLAYSGWQDDQAARRGAALAFYSILSLGPLLLLVLVVAATVWDRNVARGQVMAQMINLMGDQGAEAVRSMLTATSDNKQGGLLATMFGIAMLIFSASGVFGELQDSMNAIWKVKPQTGKPILRMMRERFLSFTMVLGTAFLLLVSLALSAAFAAAANYASKSFPVFALTAPLMDFGFSFVMISFLFAVIFKMVPDVPIAWRSVAPGAMLTAALFVIGKMLIGFYLGHTGVASSYGAAGSVVIILIWVYYSAQILFFGAEFAAVGHRQRAKRQKS